ncbi:MAG TPA: hypothetical protein VND65_06085 [Candidatus Binatia bacterium]|nr:hypothetical protein [Candidatus Binatia bacterium]
MRPRILVTILLTALFVVLTACSTTPGCPTCGTTVNGSYAIINVIPVPEHNATGEPGGPFNSFDISWISGPPSGGMSGTNNLDYISDRIGIAVQVIDTAQDLAMFSIQGQNSVSDAGNGASPCAVDPATGNDVIPPIVDVFGNFTRHGCRTDLTWEGGPMFHLITGFGASHHFGAFPGAQCCASRANGVNPMSGPDGLEVSGDGNTLFVGNGSSSVVVFDLTTMNLAAQTPPTVLADIPTGVSADYDGPQGISGCIASWNGEAGSATDCGDDRADEMSFDNVHKVLAIINGDPGFPFVTFIDMSGVVARNPADTLQRQHCLPIDSTLAYGPYPPGFSAATYPLQGSGTGVPPSLQLDPTIGGSFNPPSCILGQIYYDGAGGGVGLRSDLAVDTIGGTIPCPDPSNPHVFSGVSGSSTDAVGSVGYPGFGTTPSGTAYTIPCHHGPLLDQNTGAFCSQTPPFPDSNCGGAISPAGLGGMVWDPNSGYLLLANENSVANINIGSIDVIDPRLTDTTCGGVSCGPVVVDSLVMPNCMPTGVSHGPGNNFLVGCADHDGKSFPPNEYIITYTPGASIVCTSDPNTSVNCVPINNVGGVDETWYNPTDNKYYLAARDMLPTAVMGVIDAKTNQWLENMQTGSNAHSISVDPKTNHAFVPLQSGAVCTTLNSYGCVGVAAEQ